MAGTHVMAANGELQLLARRCTYVGLCVYICTFTCVDMLCVYTYTYTCIYVYI